MLRKNFFTDEKGVVSTEYVVFVAAIATLLVIGVSGLFNAMGGYFNRWATFFAGS
jgi:Flp pilus assembly pilin Flp